MAQSDTMAGVLSPTAEDHSASSSADYQANRMPPPSSPRYQSLTMQRNLSMESTIASSMREKPRPVGGGLSSTLFGKDTDITSNFSVPATYSSSNGIDNAFMTQGSSLTMPTGARRNNGNNVSNLGGGSDYRQQSPLSQHSRTHHHSNTISSIASVISPLPVNSSAYDNGYSGMPKPLHNKGMTPWMNEINRPRSADIASTPGTILPQFRPSQFPARSQFAGPSVVEKGALDMEQQYAMLQESWTNAPNGPTVTTPYFAGSSSNVKTNEMVNATARQLAGLSTSSNENAKSFARNNVTPLNLGNEGNSLGQSIATSMSPRVGEFRRPDTVPARFQENYYENKGAIGEPNSSNALTGTQQGLGSPIFDRSRPMSPQYASYNSGGRDVGMQGMRSPTSWDMGFSFPNSPAPTQQRQSQQQQAQGTYSPFKPKPGMGHKSGKGHKPSNSIDLGFSGRMGLTGSPKPQAATPTAPANPPAPAQPPHQENYADLALLQDIGAWLKSLRLHKYTECLKDLTWQELVELDDAQLDARGVNALGARRKMLKVFDQIKEAQKKKTETAVAG